MSLTWKGYQLLQFLQLEWAESGQVFSLVPFMTSANARQPQVLLTWVNQAGVTLIVLIPAARDGVTHNFLLSRADTFNLIIFTALATHDIPLGSGAGFINDCVLWNRNQQVRTKVSVGRVRPISTLLLKSNPALQMYCPAWMIERTLRILPGQHLPSGVAYLRGYSKPPSVHRWNLWELLFIFIF